ncbi:hypothetical protein Kpol_448p12 [Vanderwaltozyma polyspora DSM 70294]|uniref:Uncharacterized protein n=1 Tax=Vanderwaltozyma polyspora (strain ATCC 22028 / DSM 70294 / BCRC 21397 / CBS 2163 / NBRC 10782 / NRRL Y-8283 / UCD 57-17) TaxID=436907 RepID=A7TQY7_VANPO|nr:uncharacterized protein Kpol_448p12 [Vanderwaltozyma polyspora DSM 70294]EDO15324.1 hypothetical protein Kpol_448p12 [Vanderwaltozyma polyspora DSM 70294]
MFSFFKQIRDIFTESHTSYQQIQLSRKAFFQFLGYLSSCVLITLVTQSNYLE